MISPTCQAACLTGIFAHYLGVACKSFAMKCGLDQPALSCVQRVFASQKAFAHHGAPSLHDRPAYLLGGMDDEELLDEVGMVQEECVFPTETEVHDIPVGRGESLQIRERTTTERDSFAETEARTRSGCLWVQVHARAPFHPLPRTNRRHTHSHNERSVKAELSLGAMTRA